MYKTGKEVNMNPNKLILQNNVVEGEEEGIYI